MCHRFRQSPSLKIGESGSERSPPLWGRCRQAEEGRLALNSPRAGRAAKPKPARSKAPRVKPCKAANSSRRVRPGLPRKIMAVAENDIDLALLVHMFSRRRPGAERRQAAGFPHSAGLARQLALRLPAREAFGMARQIVERVFQASGCGAAGWLCRWGRPGSERGWAAETPGQKSRERKCAERPAPCPIARPFLRPAKIRRRKPLQRINERKRRKAILLFFQSLLKLVSQPRRESPSMLQAAASPQCRWRR